MRVLVIGGGGREHALAWRLAQSPSVAAVFCHPGNAGTAAFAPPLPTQAAPETPAFVEAVTAAAIDLVVVGPEAPLVAGAADRLRAAGVDVLGPGADGARLEGSKAFCKTFLNRYEIPTAAHAAFDDAEAACAYLRAQGAPIVVKADGLAAGKGVVVAQTVDEAETAVRAMLAGERHGDAGRRVVVEQYLQGEEVSVIALSDGERLVPLLASQDHKRAFDGDAGPNTGGMGAYAPTSVVDARMQRRIHDEILQPTLAGLRAEGIDFRGFLYAGLMLVDGEPYVLEYNVRFGDPECQPLMLLMDGDFGAVAAAAARGRLDTAPPLAWRSGTAVCVVLASDGYPGAYARGVAMPEPPAPRDDVVVFHAGTRRVDGRLQTAGGRVLGVTARGDTVAAARAAAYAAAERARWPGAHMRHDIGVRELQRAQRL